MDNNNNPLVTGSKKVKKRRVPKQARSIERVNRILDTASELMANPQQQRVSTHLIAEKAGVSVGSLYQFFPNVESIKIALIERLLEQYFQYFRGTIAANPNIKSLEEFTGLLVDATHNFFHLNPQVVHHIVSCSHTEEFVQVNQALNQRVKTLMLAYFNDRDFGVSAQDLERKVDVAIALGDVMTMFIWTSESEQQQRAYLRDWRRLTAFYSTLDLDSKP